MAEPLKIAMISKPRAEDSTLRLASSGQIFNARMFVGWTILPKFRVDGKPWSRSPSEGKPYVENDSNNGEKRTVFGS